MNTKRFYFLLFFSLLFFQLSFGQESNIDSCKDNLDQYWQEAGAFINQENHVETIRTLENVLECGKTTKITPGHITGAKAYIARSFLKLENLDSAKFYIDELKEDLIFFGEENDFHKIHSVLSGYLYSQYYSQKGFYELAAVHFEKLIDNIFEDINYEENRFLDKDKILDVYWFPVLDLFNNAALNHKRVGDYTKANLYYKIALEFSDNQDEWQLAIVHQNLARSYLMLREYDLSLKHFNIVEDLLQGLTNNENNNNALGTTYKNKAEYYFKTEKIDSSFIYLKKALSLNVDDKTKTAIYQLYAEVLIEKKSYDAALDQLELAFDFTDKEYGGKHPEMAANYLIKADLISALGDTKKADGIYNKGLGILTQQETCNCKNIIVKDIFEKNLALDIIQKKAKNLTSIENTDEWKDCYYLLDKLTQELNNKYILSESSKYNLAQRAKGFYAEAIEAFIKDGSIKEAYQFSRLAKGMVLLQHVKDKKAIKAGSVPEKVIEEGKNLKFGINELQKIKEKAFIDNDEELVKISEERLVSIENEYELWVKKIEKEYLIYYQLKYDNSPASLQEIQAEISKENATVLEYFLTQSILYLFIINEDDVNVEVIELGDDFRSNISLFHSIVSKNDYSQKSFNDFCKASFGLYQYLIKKPVENELLKQNLIIVPDEEINLISFEALVSEDYDLDKDKIEYHKLKYLLNSYSISYQYSSDLIPSFKKSRKENNFLGIAPVFQNKNIEKLEENIKEVKSLRDKMNGQVLTGHDATYGKMKEKIKDFNIIHFATHAVFNDEVPLDSRIELADTSLYIYELYALEHHWDLVVLSACETASGKQQKGEGVISLSRALIQSGCPSVISSLWEVSDQKSSQIMNGFYEQFTEGNTTKESLALSKRNFIKKTISRNTHPFYWAGFVHIGKPLEYNNSNIFYFYLIPVMIFIFIFGFIYFKYFNKK